MRKKIYILFLHIVVSFGAYAQYVSPFNGKTVSNDSSGNYSFIVSGHFYGQQSNTTGYPVNTLLAHLDWINDRNDLMLVSLGDLFMDVSNDIPKYENSLFNKLKVPLVNTVGNHDLTGDIYQQNYGPTNFSFEIGSDLHIVLDTEENDGDLNDDQLGFIRAAQDKKFEHVFIYSHRTIWKDKYDEMDGIFEDNTQSVLGGNYESDVYPLIEELSLKSKVYWFSGSMGNAPASFFYHQDKEITYIATAIRGLKRDAMLIVHVENGKVSFEPYSLTGEELMNIESYNVDYWQQNAGKEPFNYRLLPLYVKNTILSWSFWWGVLSSSVVILFISWFLKKRRKRINQS